MPEFCARLVQPSTSFLRQNVLRDHMVADGAGHYFLAGFLKGETGREGGRDRERKKNGDVKGYTVGKGKTRGPTKLPENCSSAFRFSEIIL